MGKTFKSKHESYDDESDKRNDHKNKNRNQKKIVNALRSKNLDELKYLCDEDED